MSCDQPAFQQVVQMGNGFADGKPFLLNWKFLPVFTAHGPGHPGADLAGVESRFFPDDGKGLIDAPVVMFFNLANPFINVHIIFSVSWKCKSDIQLPDFF